MNKTLEMYLALDRTHPQIVDSLLAEIGDELAGAVIAARKADVITDQKRIDLLVGALAKAEKERDDLRAQVGGIVSANRRAGKSHAAEIYKTIQRMSGGTSKYSAAERAAQWCERSDDFEEAAAVRLLITEHAALTASQPTQRKPIGYLFQTPIPPRNIEDFYEMRWGQVEYCPVENKHMLDEMPSVKIQVVYAD